MGSTTQRHSASGDAGHAFLAQNRRVRESGQQGSLDQFLAADIQFQFDVVLGLLVDFFDRGLVAAHQAAGLARGLHGASQGLGQF